MIVPMKKVHLIVQKKDIVASLESLCELGVLHVEHQEALSSYELNEFKEEVELLEKVLTVLKKEQKELKGEIPQVSLNEWTEPANQVLSETADIEHIEDQMLKRELLIKAWSAWGDFNPKDIEELASKGVHVGLYSGSAQDIAQIPEGCIVKNIFKQGKTQYCVVISCQPVEIKLEKIALPEYGLNELKKMQEEDFLRIEKNKKQIQEYIKYADAFGKQLTRSSASLRFEEVATGMKKVEELQVLKGFCPVDLCEGLQSAASKEGWGLLLEDPADDDRIPTLLKNPKWVNLIKPVFELIEVLPGYKEFDVSMVFLFFFTAFFGILIGDAAYGAIFALGTVFAHIKLGKTMEDKTPFFLMYILTGVTIVWGVLTGTYFGQEWLAPTSIKATMPWLNDQTNIQYVCFVIALVHLSIARLWAAVSRFPCVTGLGQLGWLLIVWGMFYTANYFVLGMAFPAFAKWFFYIGIPLAFFFMVPPKVFLKTVPMELIPFILNVIGAGTDIVSYIRLFAVGLATVAVADAANAMPENFGMIAGTFGLIFLHALNMILAAMAILVHAVRLNVLEFSGHLSLQWSGEKYAPFKA